MKLSDRLERIAAKAAGVTEGYAADVGTDHGFVPIRLIESGKVKHVVAMDVRKGPLERACEHVGEYHMEDQIETRLSDGLKELKPGEADTVIIAGMGGELMLRILRDGAHVRNSVKHYILSPQSELSVFRHGLEELGFSIVEEEMLLDEGKYYVILHVSPGTMHYEHEYEYRYGADLIRKQDPVLKEFLERELIDIVERNLHKLLPVKEGDAVLIVMYDAGSEQELLSACTEASDAALEAGAIDVYIADTPERIASVWSVRGAILEGMKAESVAQEECDVVVPRAKIAEYVRLAKGIGAKYGIRVEPCGHAGDGNIHTEMLRDASMSDEDWIKGTRACLTELYGVSKQFGGQLSGEHGIGNGRLEYLKPFVGDRMYKLYQSIKLAFDEKLILNPGKIITFDE